MLLLTCPHCGERNASEFRYGGEYNPRPTPSMEAGEVQWVRYLYLRGNPMGQQREWWYHRSGCGQWFLAERDRATNTVTRTFLWNQDGESAS
jgi:heterotetrameric sarcosine oxidase delta subunit